MKANRKQSGASLVEYVILAFFIAVICVVAVTNTGTNLKAKYSNIESQLP